MQGMRERGAFLLSIDTELAWGTVHLGQVKRYQAQYARCREVINRLLELMERYNIRTTWAVVGHLFLEECHPVDGIKHPEIIRPSYQWSSGDWFSTDPCTQLEAAPEWYGADIMERIFSCKVAQEIGCHTFSHIRVGDPGCSPECIESELNACQEWAEKIGVKLSSLVFPWNSVGHLDSLRKYGFIAYRGPSSSWFAGLPIPLRRLAHLLDHWLLIPPPLDTVSCEMDVWNLPASYFYVCGAGWGKMIPLSLRVQKVKQGLRLAMKKRRAFHLWFHPFNLASNTELWLKGLEQIFAEVNRYQEMGLLDNPTMGDLARELQSSSQDNNNVALPLLVGEGGP